MNRQHYLIRNASGAPTGCIRADTVIITAERADHPTSTYSRVTAKDCVWCAAKTCLLCGRPAPKLFTITTTKPYGRHTLVITKKGCIACFERAKGP